MGFVSGYSGATAFEFHELPFLLHGFWLSKNCAHTIMSDFYVNSRLASILLHFSDDSRYSAALIHAVPLPAGWRRKERLVEIVVDTSPRNEVNKPAFYGLKG